MIGLSERITYFSVVHEWWKQPPQWRAFASKVDEEFRRVKGFEAIADNPSIALDRVLETARTYVFAPILQPIDMGLDLDLML